MPDLVSLISTFVPSQYIAVATSAIAVAAAITAALPPPRNPKLASVFKVLNVLALNVGNAKNLGKSEPKAN